MRLFLAIFPPADARDAALSAVVPLRAPGNGVSWVKRDNLHFTLRFLGELDDVTARRAGDAAAEAVKGHRAFGAALGGFGAFPTAKKARVLWIGLLSGAEPMRLLAESLEQALAKRGFDPADPPFEPHLTVGRLRDASDWTAKLVAAASCEARFQVDRVQLVRSELSPRGALYEPLREFPLSAPA